MDAIATWIHTVPESSVKTSNDLVYCVLIVHVFNVYTFYPIQWFCNARSADMACAYAQLTIAYIGSTQCMCNSETK